MAKKSRPAKPPAARSATPRAARAAVRAAPGARDRIILSALALVVVIGLAYGPALDGGFINWDDPNYVTMNQDIRSLSWKMVGWAFTTFHTGNWHPLTWISLALDHALWGLRPFGYHLTSLVLHVANTVLLLAVLHRLTGAVWRSVAVAALFGLHPLHVESVAWVSERKDVLCAFFWLATMGAYARWVRTRTPASYVLVVFGFALALLAKPMAITLPLVLLLLDYWPLDRLSWRAVREKIPLFAVAGAHAVATVLAQRAGGAVLIDPIPLGGRIANALVSYLRYLRLTFWPLHLSPWYSHPALEGAPLSAAEVVAAAVVLLGVSALAVWLARRRPWLPVGWFWFLGTLVPVIGIVQVGRQGMADRYTYIPHIGLFLLLVWGAAELPLWNARRGRFAGAAATAVLLSALGVLTFRQTRIWHDSISFWRQTVAESPYSFVGHQALGGLLMSQGKYQEALPEYRRAAHLRAGIADVHAQLGYLLARDGRYGPAAAQYRKAVALRPDSAEHQNNLADVLLRQRRPVQARRHVERALALRPDYPEALNNFGRVLAVEGRLDEAVEQFRAALRVNPRLATAQQNLAATLDRQQRAGVAVSQ